MGPVLYMLEAYEELFSKELDRLVEEVLRYIMCTLYVYNTNIHQSIIWLNKWYLYRWKMLMEILYRTNVKLHFYLVFELET